MYRFSPLALLMLTACPGFGDTDQSVLLEVPERPVYNDVAQITATYCLRCHNEGNPQGQFAGDSYPSLYSSRQDASGVVDQGNMPPLTEAPMSKVDRETFIKWVTIGAPEE